MREGLLVQKKEEEEYKKLSDLAQGGRDASEFLSWQQEMRRMDLENKLAEIEANRISGLLSYEEAILARQSLVDENRKKVESIKKEVKHFTIIVYMIDIIHKLDGTFLIKFFVFLLISRPKK